MSYETKEMSGALFVNENKERDTQPDYTGNVKINGKLWRFAGWKTESRGGIEYISLKVTDPEEYARQREQGGRGQTSAPSGRMSERSFEQRRQEMRDRGRAARPNDRDDPPPMRTNTQEFDFGDDDIPF